VASRSDGARVWAIVLSELAGVPVAVEWERPAWRVRWVDGPTRSVLVDRAVALGRYRVGSPLPAQALQFSRSSSSFALALAWLRAADLAGRSDAVGQVERIAEDTGYPQGRADPTSGATADLLCRLAGGESVVMGRLLADAHPAVIPRPTTQAVPELVGRVVSLRWPSGGPPHHLLGPSGPATTASDIPAAGACAYCGVSLPPRVGRGRPARYCGGAHRVAAHRARIRNNQAPSSTDRGNEIRPT
jgi:hypothetical protein